MLREFFIFGFMIKKIYEKENQIWLKLVKNLCTFKLFDFYIEELK